jgi:hypothetical protein
VNVAVGYGIAVAAQIIVFPIFGVHISIRQNIEIGIIMTAVSIARSYTVPRFQRLAPRGASMTGDTPSPFELAAAALHAPIVAPPAYRSPTDLGDR